MATQDEISGAEHELAVAMRVLRRCELKTEDRDAYDAAGDRVDAAMAALDALVSPLPTREEFGAREDAHTDLGLSDHAIAEYHWADCLRWVADHWGGKSTDLFSLHGHKTLKELADELEARP